MNDFCAQHLKENPNLDLISFFILRTQTDERVARSNDELSLIPFPTEQLFTTELESFDVVVFQNFDYRPYDVAAYLKNITAAVRDAGLGFVMIGGNQSFEAGGYKGTTIEDILPVQLDDSQYTPREFRMQLSAIGGRHPVTALARGRELNRSVWADLPTLRGLHDLLPPQANANVLVVATQPGGERRPLISVAEVGQGRVMAIATDALWRLRFSKAEDGGLSERAYHRLWSNIFRWLVRDPAHSRLRLRVSEGDSSDASAAEGEQVLARGLQIEGSLVDAAYEAQAGAAIRLRVSGGALPDPLLSDLRSDKEGQFIQTTQRLPPGAYRIDAEALLGGRKIASTRKIHVLEARHAEFDQPRANPQLLEALAELSGGKLLQADKPGQLTELPFRSREVLDIEKVENFEFWDNGWALALLTLLFALEWWWRRRLGYV